MKKSIVYLLILIVVAITSGCGGSSSNTGESSGAVSLSIDLTKLQMNAKTATKKASGSTNKTVFSIASSNTTTITAVTATLSRNGFDDITRNLNIANNVASATIAGLQQGYWHVTANVFSGNTMIYSGSVDTNIIANAQVSAEILFDPVILPIDPTTTGSISLTVGLNKFPGYKKINQYVASILQDTVNQKFYIFDSSSNIVAIYNADTMVREKDISLQSTPQALAVDPAGGNLLLGYATGKIYRLNTATQEITMLADSLISITDMIPITSNYLLVCNGVTWGSSNSYKTINLSNGQIITSQSYWYPLNSFVYNQTTGVAYALDSGLSPADMHHLAISTNSGTITSVGDSRYHGDYSFGGPLRIINKGTRIASGSGNMFISSALSADDITYAGNIGHPYIDLVSDDTLNNLYMLNNDNIKKLLVMKQDSFFTTLSIDLVATPKRVFSTSNSIVVFVQSDSTYYAKVFGKQSLGLI